MYLAYIDHDHHNSHHDGELELVFPGPAAIVEIAHLCAEACCRGCLWIAAAIDLLQDDFEVERGWSNAPIHIVVSIHNEQDGVDQHVKQQKSERYKDEQGGSLDAMVWFLK